MSSESCAPRSLCAPASVMAARSARRSRSARSAFATADETRVIDQQRRARQHALRRQPGLDGRRQPRHARSPITQRRSASAVGERDHEQARRRDARGRGRSRRRASREARRRKTPSAMPELGAADVSRTARGWSEPTALARPDGARAPQRSAVTEPARAAGLIATGYLETQAGATALANSKGLFAYDGTTARRDDDDGAHARRHRLRAGPARRHTTSARLDAAHVGARAIEKAQALARIRSPSSRAATPSFSSRRRSGNLVQLIAGAMQARAAPTRDARSSRSRAAATRSA